MSKVWSYYFYLLLIVAGHKLYRWYNTKKDENTGEKQGDSNKFRDGLDSLVYKIGFIITISFVIEILSGIYFANEIIQNFKRFDKQGITSAKIFNGRCSGAYYYTYNCDQKNLAGELDKCDNIAKALVGGLVHEISYKSINVLTEDFAGGFGNENYYNNHVFSGLQIDCSPGHSRKLKEKIVKYKWDGPNPVHSDDDCKKAHQPDVLRMSSYS